MKSHELTQFVSQHPHLFVLTGAGCSTASGLGDYRDRQGQWKRKQPITGQTFIQNSASRKRYWARSSIGWPSFAAAKPSEAHHALARLQALGYAQTLITQNVDELHQKAGHRDVVDLHGVLSTVSCIDCGNQMHRSHFQHQLLKRNDWLNQLDASHAPDGDADLELASLDDMQVPDCSLCGGLLKPDVVFFGENVASLIVQEAKQALARADALLIAGSSLMVYSGFRFCRQAEALGLPIAIVNQGQTRADTLATLKCEGDCGQLLSELADELVRSPLHQARSPSTASLNGLSRE